MSQALQRTYDGIIIGAGHHGLVLGSYLAKAGLDVLLVDRRLTYGGGLNTTTGSSGASSPSPVLEIQGFGSSCCSAPSSLRASVDDFRLVLLAQS